MKSASNNSLSLYADLKKSLSEIHEAYGNYQAAYITYKSYLQLNEELLGEEKRNELARNQLYYEFEKKESALRFENELAVSKLKSQELLNERQKQEIAISKKEEEIQKLAYLKEQAERQEKEKELSLIRKEKELNQSQLLAMTKEKNLQGLLLVGQKKQQKWFIAGLVLSFLLAVSVLFGLFRTKIEKKKSDSLLLNILPEDVAKELKLKGYSTARQFSEVSVIFTDFVGFTSISEELTPTELVQEIHTHFTTFDHIMEKYGLEKIKTIGDAYLAVCGLPVEKSDHALRTIQAAKEILNYLEEQNSRFKIRIGIHSGAVVAGIVGVKKYAYDIWGDTVNTAARMEQNSIESRINISGTTATLISDTIALEYRGKLPVKNKGEIDMYFVM
jgi:class 3 adenylate cyclase